MKTCRAGILSHLYVSSGFSEIDHGNELMHGAAKRMLAITKQHGNSQAAREQPSSTGTAKQAHDYSRVGFNG